MGNEFLINRNFIEAIGIPNLLIYFAVLILELGILFFFTDRNPWLRRRTLYVILVLFFLNFAFQSFTLFCIGFCIVLIITAVFVNTRLGFASSNYYPSYRIRIAPIFIRAIMWAVLMLLSYTLWIGCSLIITFVKGPVTIQSEVWKEWHNHRSGTVVLLLFDPNEERSIEASLPEKFDPLFEEGQCLEVTFYQPPLGDMGSMNLLESHVTRIRESDSCK